MLKLITKSAANVLHILPRFFWCTISGRVKNSVLSACRPVRPPFCFAKPLVRLYAARGVHCSLPAFAYAQSWPLLTNPQPFLATSPRETNTSACAKCESVPKGMVQQKSRNICCGFFWCTISGRVKKMLLRSIFSDQSPRDEHERLCEVRVRPEGNGAAKKPQHSLRLFLVHHRGLSRALKTPHWGVFARRTGGGPELFSSPDGTPDRAFLK